MIPQAVDDQIDQYSFRLLHCSFFSATAAARLLLDTPPLITSFVVCFTMGIPLES